MANTPVLFAANAGELGVFHLEVNYRSERINAHGGLLDAILIGSLEPVIATFEDLIDHPLEWVANAVENDKEPGAMLELVINYDKRQIVDSARFKLPFDSLPMLEKWAVQLTDAIVDCKWTPIRVDVCLSNLSLSVEECADLSQGALVMIPESFNSSWRASVCVGGYEIDGVYRLADDLWIRSDDAYLDVAVASSLNSENSAPPEQPFQPVSKHCLLVAQQIDPIELLNQGAYISNVISDLVRNDTDTSARSSGLRLSLPDGDSFLAHMLPLAKGQAVLLENKLTTAA